MHQQSQQLVLSNVSHQLAEAESFDEIKTLRDKAEAVRAYAKSARLGLQAQNRAAEVKLQAERKAGELLRGLDLHGGDRKTNGHGDCLKLDDLGITRDQSARWQKEASLPDEEFELFIAEANGRDAEISSASLIRRARAWSTENGSIQPEANQDSQNQEASDPAPSEDAARYPDWSQFGDVMETLADLRGHHDVVANLLNPTGSDTPPKSDAERLLHHYLSEIGQLVARLEKLLR